VSPAGPSPDLRVGDLRFGLTLANRGVLLGLTTPAALLDLAARAEESGRFDSIWVGDSLFAKPRLDALTLLAALAARTRSVRLGPRVWPASLSATLWSSPTSGRAWTRSRADAAC